MTADRFVEPTSRYAVEFGQIGIKKNTLASDLSDPTTDVESLFERYCSRHAQGRTADT